MSETTSPARVHPANRGDDRYVNPDCHACKGTGTDAVFGTDCAECEIEAGRDAMMRAAYAGVRTTRDDRAHTPGERLDGRTFGASPTGADASPKQIAFLTRLVEERPRNTDDVTAAARAVLGSDCPLDKRSASRMIDAILKVAIVADDDGPAWCANRASDKQIAFIESLLADRDRSDEKTKAECETIEMLIRERQMNKRAASACIDMLKGMPRRPIEATGPVDGLDLSPLAAFTSRGLIRFGVPGSDTRLKVQVKFVDRGRWAGFVFVSDGAEYGASKRYGRQAPGKAYDGEIVAELTAILADPQAAVTRYAELTSRCGVCNAPLEDEASVARGMGPVCAAKFG